MAGNTIMTAKNSFQKGILMDFSPENTSADSLTSALNATFVTFNGNEGSLQNDMGNGRVETAYLPEGYVPVGSCEFGDIIYIVSYNPLIDKAQIGCFPSPERNLSSDELGQEPVVITSDKFQDVINIKYYQIPPAVNEYKECTKEQYERITGSKRDYDKFPTEIEYNEKGFPKYLAIRVITLTGRLKTGSIKEILYKSNLNPGDQYIITHSEDSDLTKVTDYETTFRKLNGLPKLLNVKVVSIEDSGRMTVLDSNVKWYDLKNNEEGNPRNYFKFISHGKDNSETKIDLDSHRSIVSSAYNIYSSKVSGKLALLIELEKISGFSCGWEALASNREITTEYCTLPVGDNPKEETIWSTVFTEEEGKVTWFRYDIDSVNWSTPRIYSEQNLPHEYDIYFNYSWETNNKNINPKYSILTQSIIENENGVNVNTLTNDTRKEIIIPNQYDELNPAPLHTFGRLYKPENSDSYYLYDTYIKEYLNAGKIIDSGNSSNSNITTIQHVIEDGKYQFDNETIGNETVEVGKYLLNATRGEVLANGYKYYNNNKEIIPVTISDDVINNTFKTQVRKKLGTFVVPGNTPNINYHYKVCPAMPYGMLEEYTIDDVIQLDKLGTTNIQVKDWRYYVYSNLLTLTWGLDAYTEPGKEISEVILEFYDNCGICAAYHANNYNSYNGTFTTNIPLDAKNQILNNKTWEENEFVHLGKLVLDTIATDEHNRRVPIYTRKDGEYTKYNYNNEIIGYSYTEHNYKKGNTDYYYDDSGLLYSNLLYLVKIIVKVENKLSTGEYINNNKPLIFYRWLWTNTLLNDFYQKVTDFDYIQPSLNLDLNCTYNTKTSDDDGLVSWTTSESKKEIINLNDQLKTSYYVQNINNAQEPNIKITPYVYLVNNYNTFKLNSDYFIDMNVILSLANEYVENTPEQTMIKYYDKTIPGLTQLFEKEKNKNKFNLSAEISSSQYAVDVTLSNKNNHYKLNKYGKLV